MINDYTIDSFTCLTPTRYFDSLPEQIWDKARTYVIETGEIISEKLNPIYHVEDGITTRISIFRTPLEQFLRVTFTSKHLKSKYFEGLNFSNFQEVFRDFCLKFDIKIDFFTFLKETVVNDIDFCYNFYLDDYSYTFLLQQFNSVDSARFFYDEQQNYLDIKRMTGLQFVNRRDASISSPFVKYYSKEFELLSRSEDFFYKYLKNSKVSLKYLRRCEVTIKNQKHFLSVFRYVNLQHKTNRLEDLFSLSSLQIRDIIISLVSRYIDGYQIDVNRKLESVKGITPTRYLLCQMAVELLENGHNLKSILGLLDSLPDLSSNAKWRIERRLKEDLPFIESFRNIKDLRVTALDAFKIPS